MPLYEYACDSCGNRFERIQKFSDPPVKTCPTCGKRVRKLISSPAIQFKGSGWYITDYARAGADKSKSSDAAGKDSGSDSSSQPSEASGAKTEEKAAGKADSTPKTGEGASSSSTPASGAGSGTKPAK